VKKIILAGILATALTAQAAEIQLLPQPWYAEVQKVLYLPIGWVISFASVVTGNVPTLCTALHGQYTPYAADQCATPPASWLYLVPGANIPTPN